MRKDGCEAVKQSSDGMFLVCREEPGEGGFTRISPEALDQRADELAIPRRTGLPEDVQRVANNVRRALASDPQGFIDAYRKEFGNTFNADDAMELFAEYAASPESRAKYGTATHGAARWVRDRAFEQALSDPESQEHVIFTSGGSASGKSTGAVGIGDEPALIYDSTLSNLNGSEAIIEMALRCGKQVIIAFIRRPLEESFTANLARAMSVQTGGGRTTSIVSMISTHKGADETLMALSQIQKRPPRLLRYNRQ